MMNVNASNNDIRIPENVDIVFVSDAFSSQLLGGAELSLQALIDACPLRSCAINSQALTLGTLESGMGKHWIFGNFSGVKPELIPSIIGNLKYSIIEFDYKFCRYRSIQKHKIAEGVECNCDQDHHGKMISAFFHGAQSLWWMSEKQKKIYEDRFPFLQDKINSYVLSSVFDDKFFVAIQNLNTSPRSRNGWIVLNSSSWIKGTSDALDYCKLNNLPESLVGNISYDEMLKNLSVAEGLIFLPRGDDTCPRLVIEAKLLGCKLVLNDHVQHKDEEWFKTDDNDVTLSYLYAARNRFWQTVKSIINYIPTISGYTTTKDCISQNYPFEASIRSMLDFCSEVCVVDGGSTDGTLEKLASLAAEFDGKLKFKVVPRDWNNKRFAIFDGLQKAEARKMCTGDFCWQQDSDEIVSENDYDAIKGIAKDFPPGLALLALPVIDYWGREWKVRLDVMPWKWRISRNHPSITHGIPSDLRVYETETDYYAKPGTDGCDYISVVDGSRIPCGSFYTQDVEQLRQNALFNHEARAAYQKWFNKIVSELPAVHHYSWWDIGRKIRTYRDYWSKHWQSLYNISQADTAENNMFFDRPWDQVSDDEIDELAKKLETEMGGWIFHRKIDFSQKTLHLFPIQQHPSYIADWLHNGDV